MAFFKKQHSKDPEAKDLPPTPKAPENNDLPVPPPPSPQLNPMEEKLEEGATLSPPPVIRGDIPDIKSLVNPVEKKEEDNHDEDEFSSLTDDSLFDFSNMSNSESFEDSNLSEEHDELRRKSLDNNNENRLIPSDDTEKSTDLTFTKRNQHSFGNKKENSIFITTIQFKALFEIIEDVKDRVSAGNETHLRLLDLKAEEDIEYENLRKDFQFLEDKLYELDSIIFEK
jgi:hypothetical protein